MEMFTRTGGSSTEMSTRKGISPAAALTASAAVGRGHSWPSSVRRCSSRWIASRAAATRSAMLAPETDRPGKSGTLA